MKNGDQPINPVECDYREGKINGAQTGNTTGYELGLTKREYFAAMAMQGMLSSDIHAPHPARTSYDDISMVVGYSVQYADALLSELEKPTDK